MPFTFHCRWICLLHHLESPLDLFLCLILFLPDWVLEFLQLLWKFFCHLINLLFLAVHEALIVLHIVVQILLEQHFVWAKVCVTLLLLVWEHTLNLFQILLNLLYLCCKVWIYLRNHILRSGHHSYCITLYGSLVTVYMLLILLYFLLVFANLLF